MSLPNGIHLLEIYEIDTNHLHQEINVVFLKCVGGLIIDVSGNYMTTLSSDFVNDIISQKESLSKEFCITHEKRIKDIKSKINRNIIHQIKLVVKDKNIVKNSYGLDVLQLIDRATKLNITCLELIERLNFIESAILTRSIIELCSTAIAICKDEKTYSGFLANKKFESSKTISISKKFIPEISRIWGDLSNYLIHINSLIHGASKSITEDKTNLVTEYQFTTFETYIPEENIDMHFDYINLITYLIYSSLRGLR